jgi:hypothetical protein
MIVIGKFGNKIISTFALFMGYGETETGRNGEKEKMSA